MGTFVVVEVHNHFQCCLQFFNGAELHSLKQLILDGTVYPFSHGVILGIAAFGHADSYTQAFQPSGVS